MCGLIFVKRHDGLNATKVIEKRYKAQKVRGSEGYGFVALNGGIYDRCLKSTNEESILNALREKTSDEIMFHHRNPTSTPNLWEVAHPFFVSHKDLKHDYYIIHNGVITNSEDLKKDHDRDGYEYQSLLRAYCLTKEDNVYDGPITWNDSESFAIEAAKELDREYPVSLSNVKGSIAFIAVQLNKETKKAAKLFWGRNVDRPLLIYKHKDFFMIASEGKGDIVPVHKLCSYDYESKEFIEKGLTIGTAASYYEKGGYQGGFPARRIGFADGRDDEDTFEKLPIIGEKADNIVDSVIEFDYEEWMDAENELIVINGSLKKGGLNPEMIDFNLTRKAELEHLIDKFNEKYPSKNLAVTAA